MDHINNANNHHYHQKQQQQQPNIILFATYNEQTAQATSYAEPKHIFGVARLLFAESFSFVEFLKSRLFIS